ncbi:3'-5' exonuclease [Nocardia higoensis]|uniref:3'-5' exonuclease n=1 Tax=Nocardia higoensis TaxID=228599 RepID=UPI0003035C80|nr:3'-5' exonuclease [Nocardia higoensis]
MANIVMTNQNKSLAAVDGSIVTRVYSFLAKLQADDTAAGLHIEPMKGAVDRRVRTGRVDLNHRAVLFRVDPNEGGTTYVYLGTWKHDVANSIAERAILRVNPVNGILEGIIGDPVAEPATPEPAASRPTAPEQTTRGFLAEAGFTLAELTDQLGMDATIAKRALAAADDFELNDIAAGVTGWQADALLELGCGVSIDEIREKYRFTEVPVDTGADEDDRIIEALEHPASKIQFTYIDGSEELRRVIEGGDFAAWRVFLHPEQREYAEKDYSGPFRLSGGAGTGKTVVAIHRARNLLARNPEARIVLTTFNKTLAKNLETDLRALDPDIRIAPRPGLPGVYVAGIDKLASDIVRAAEDIGPATEAVLGTRTEVPSARTKDQVWRELVDTIDHGLEPRLATPWFLDTEYTSVVLANKVTTVERYARVARAGRGVRLSRQQRLAIWKLVEAYRRRSRMDETLSFPEVLAIAAEHLQQRAAVNAARLADHVIVDEAQDLHATHWLMLRALVAEGPNDLFIAEDSHQRIYGQPVVLGRLGIKIVGRSRRLTLNYRTTAQNLDFAVGVLSGADYQDLEEGREFAVEQYRSARTGPKPVLRQCDSVAAELEVVARFVNGWLADPAIEPSTIAVLTRGLGERSQFVRALAERRISARALDDNQAVPGHVQVLTMHRSKGMEFSRVILAGVDENRVPAKASLNGVPEEELDEARLRERSLLYVAASRARDQVVVTWSGRRSELLGK